MENQRLFDAPNEGADLFYSVIRHGDLIVKVTVHSDHQSAISTGEYFSDRSEKLTHDVYRLPPDSELAAKLDVLASWDTRDDGARSHDRA